MLVPGMHFCTHPFSARTHVYQLSGHPEICLIGVYHPLQENLLACLLSLSGHQMFTNSILLFQITNIFCTSTIPVTDKQLSSPNDDYSGTQTHCFLNYISSAFINVWEVENHISFNKWRTQFPSCLDECEGSASSYAFCCPSYNGAQPEDPDCGRKITHD